MSWLENPLELGRVRVVSQGDLLPERQQIRSPDKLPVSLVVNQAIESFGEGGGQAPVELGIQPFEVLGHVVADEDGVKAQGMPFLRSPALPGPTKVHAPNLEGVREKPLLSLAVEGIFRGERGA